MGAFSGTIADMTTCHALTLASVGLIANHAYGCVHAVVVNLLARRDRVHARCQALEHMEELLRIRNHTRKVCDQVDELASPAVLLGASTVVRTGQNFQPLNIGSQLC